MLFFTIVSKFHRAPPCYFSLFSSLFHTPEREASEKGLIQSVKVRVKQCRIEHKICLLEEYPEADQNFLQTNIQDRVNRLLRTIDLVRLVLEIVMLTKVCGTITSNDRLITEDMHLRVMEPTLDLMDEIANIVISLVNSLVFLLMPHSTNRSRRKVCQGTEMGWILAEGIHIECLL